MATPVNASIMKAFEILRLITPQQPEITSAMVACALQTNSATAHRLLTSLVAAGALISYRRGYYSLGPVVEELGFAAQSSAPLTARIRPVLQELARSMGESAMVCRLGMQGPTCISVAKADRPISVDITVGAVLAFKRTAHGKLWLSVMDDATLIARGMNGIDRAQLAEIRAQGYSVNDGEADDGIGALAVPIMDSKGEMRLSLSLFGLQQRFGAEMRQASLPALKKAADDISKLLNF